MGVIERNVIPKKAQVECDQNVPSDDELSIPDVMDSSSDGEITLRAIRHQKRRHKNVAQTSPTKPGKHSGKRRLRQYRAVEDLRILYQDQDEVLELSISDFMTLKPSPFAILLQNDNLLRAWWEFISKPQDDTDNDEQTIRKSLPHGSSVLSKPREYKRISKSLKETLQKNSMDLDVVAEVELQLAKFFLETPREILKLKKLTQFETMINTAVCQYHGLKPTQLDGVCKKRNDLIISLIGKVYGKPATALYVYLEQRRKFFSERVLQ